jgi:hypothetical protein
MQRYTNTRKPRACKGGGSRLNSPRPYLTAALPAYSGSHPTLLIQEVVKTSARCFDATLYPYDGFYSSPTNRKPPKCHFITAQTAPSLPCKPRLQVLAPAYGTDLIKDTTPSHGRPDLCPHSYKRNSCFPGTRLVARR